MTCTVKVKDGAIPLPEGLSLPEGLEVQLTIPDVEPQRPSFAERYAAYIGAADDLPADLAENLDQARTAADRANDPLFHPTRLLSQPSPGDMAERHDDYPSGATSPALDAAPVEPPPAARRERVQLPLVRCPAGTVIQPTPEELDASIWG